ncbi:hypothetical protein [Clostridium sp. DJ247]|uniref:hypothetical protein n=1 Tax=Clostridium sp. DJ247 TaxID=2726188 RepID=UPI001628FE1A|nr:hypothetical protein [Clostridium sp. DJ247]MBC2582545.1 hypothetical protein [Clostridium sp. DJ247]
MVLTLISGFLIILIMALSNSINIVSVPSNLMEMDYFSSDSYELMGIEEHVEPVVIAEESKENSFEDNKTEN